MTTPQCTHCKEVDCDNDGCLWRDVKKAQQKKRWDNDEKSIALLKEKGFTVKVLNSSLSHYRVEGVDFWATTGKFYNTKTGKKGRGVFNLIQQISS